MQSLCDSFSFPDIYNTGVNQLGNEQGNEGKKKKEKTSGRADQSHGINSESGLVDIHRQQLARNP